MVGGIRQLLRASLGLCPRHTWGYAVVEVELWVYGTGSRGGHQPFDVCVLYTDLVEQVVGRLRARRVGVRGSLAARLARTGRCRVCEALDRAPAGVVSFAGSNSDELAAEANRLRFTQGWLQQTRAVWQPRQCPGCVDRLDGNGPEAVWCLAHLTGPRPPEEVSAAGLADYVEGLGARLDALGRSMRQGVAAPTVEQDASWIETMGWFGGWELPAWLTAMPEGVADGRR